MLALRKATIADVDALLLWRNDPTTRAMSFTSDEISYDHHVAWLAGKLDDPACVLLIAEEDGAPVGQVRLDLEADMAELSIALAPEARGRGLGRRAIRLAVNEAAALGLRAVRAEIKPENLRSLAAFRAADFHIVNGNGIVEMECELVHRA